MSEPFGMMRLEAPGGEVRIVVVTQFWPHEIDRDGSDGDGRYSCQFRPTSAMKWVATNALQGDGVFQATVISCHVPGNVFHMRAMIRNVAWSLNREDRAQEVVEMEMVRIGDRSSAACPVVDCLNRTHRAKGVTHDRTT